MLDEQIGELSLQHEECNRLALEQARSAATYNRLRGEVERQRRLFDVLVERMREVDLDSDYVSTNVEIVESASTPMTPAHPRKGRIVLVAISLGLLLGVGLAFMLERMDDTIKTPDDLEERAGMPALGFVPAMVGNHSSNGDFRRRARVCLLDPTCPAAESYRSIRTNIFYSLPADASKVLAVTSVGPGDGKTTFACNLSLAIAQSGKSALLVDADFRRPMVHHAFEMANDVGLSSVLVGEVPLTDAVQQAVYGDEEMENLHILSAGPKPVNPVELLDSEAMRQFMRTAAEGYDRVVLDTAPMLLMADAAVLGALSDGVIMMVKSAVSTRALTARARERLAAVRARLLGGVVNELRVSRFGYYYSDYYHYVNYGRNYYHSRAKQREDT
jgi:capsular exopolysaccharide synthesis family protein